MKNQIEVDIELFLKTKVRYFESDLLGRNEVISLWAERQIPDPLLQGEPVIINLLC